MGFFNLINLLFLIVAVRSDAKLSPDKLPELQTDRTKFRLYGSLPPANLPLWWLTPVPLFTPSFAITGGGTPPIMSPAWPSGGSQPIWPKPPQWGKLPWANGGGQLPMPPTPWPPSGGQMPWSPSGGQMPWLPPNGGPLPMPWSARGEQLPLPWLPNGGQPPSWEGGLPSPTWGSSGSWILPPPPPPPLPPLLLPSFSSTGTQPLRFPSKLNRSPGLVPASSFLPSSWRIPY